MNELADKQSTDAGLRELALFAGAGGGILGGKLLGWRTVCGVERDAYGSSILAQRQNDRSIEPFPIWSDVESFDGRPWRGIVDVVSGGFPCQDISNSGNKKGIQGERSGLWKQMARIVCEVRPRFVFVENVAALLDRGMGVVLGDLAALGFDARWCVLGTADVDGEQPRERVWILAYAKGFGRRSVQWQPGVFQKTRSSRAGSSSNSRPKYSTNGSRPFREDKSGVVRVADGVANRVERIRVIGNGQDPRVAAAAFAMLKG